MEGICWIHVCAHMPRFPTHFTHTHTHTHTHTCTHFPPGPFRMPCPTQFLSRGTEGQRDAEMKDGDEEAQDGGCDSR